MNLGAGASPGKERARRAREELSAPPHPLGLPEPGRGERTEKGRKKPKEGQTIPHDPTASNQRASQEERRGGQGRERWRWVTALPKPALC